jgi:hypothetical protein
MRRQIAATPSRIRLGESANQSIGGVLMDAITG